VKQWRSVLAVAFVLAGAVVLRADLWTDLNTQEAEARTQAVQTVLNGSVPYLGVAAFKKATPAMRTALVQRSAAWAKAFLQSPAFKMAYDTARNNEKPEPPKKTGSYADQLKKQREEFEKSAAEMRKNAAGQSKDIQTMIENTITQMRTSLDKMANDPAQMKMMENANAQAQAADQARYAQELARFEQQHPATAQSAVALRLHTFLDTCGAVDFNAKLVGTGGSMRFVNPQYEQKPSDWKMCFRAGREPVEAAKAFATAWLKEIGG
jgi:hypothetical protein